MTAPASSPPASDPAARPWRLSLAMVGALTALRLAVAPFFGLGTDEAHYALYGLHLDWSYFDHPPLVGWIQALALLLGDTPFCLRLAPILLSAGCALLLHRLTRRLLPDASPWAPTLAVGLVLAAPMAQLAAFSALPEHPLVLFGLLAVDALFDVDRDGRARHWLRLGLMLGLAGLSKYTAVVLLVPVALVVLRRRAWTRPAAWLACALALLLVAPVFVWNARHDASSFAYQADHGAGGAWELGDAALGLAGQLLAWGPGLVLLGWGLLVRTRRDPACRVLWALAATVLALFAVAGGFATTLPHWTTLGWYALAPLVAAHALEAWDRPRIRRTLVWGSVPGVLLGVFVHVQLPTGVVPFPANADPYGNVTGFAHAARRIEAHLAAMAARPGPPPMLYVDDRWTASRVAWYARPRAVQVLDGRVDQYDLWFGEPRPGDRGLLVSWSLDADEKPPRKDLRRFASHELLEVLPVEHRGRQVATFRLWACHDHVR